MCVGLGLLIFAVLGLSQKPGVAAPARETLLTAYLRPGVTEQA